MNWFMNMKLSSKLVLSFVIVLALTTFLGIFSVMKLAAVYKTTLDLATDYVPGLEALAEIRNALNQERRWGLRIAMAVDQADRDNSLAQIETAQENMKKAQAKYEPTVRDEEEKRLYQAVLAAVKDYNAVSNEAIASYRRGDKTKGYQLLSVNGLSAFNQVTKAQQDLVDFQENATAAASKQGADIYNKGRLWVTGTLICAVVLGLLMALSIARLISRPVVEVCGVAKQIAIGDLTNKEIAVKSKDEVGQLGTSMNEMQANLRNIVHSIAENAQNVANASEEFSSVSQQITANSEETSAQANAVSAATEQVNRNLQTVATATEEMSASISEIAKNATEAAKVAGSAMATATETNSIVAKLGESSAEIGQVIKTITSIAQKTDLLALNATVDAARAGEVGAGFAVVANEVKELAKQTSIATEDISRKIEAIQTDAKSAVQAIGTISGIISQVNQISSTIAAAVEEQSATTNEMSRNLTEAAKGSGEVAQNIHGVAQAAQNTSQGATDSLKASQQLAQLSHKLRTLVEQFTLDTPSTAATLRNYSPSARRNDSYVEAEEELVTR